MAPTNDKRHTKEPGHSVVNESIYSAGSHTNSNHKHTHTKENASARHSKRGIEILDFHESWLEEMEMYKDHISGKKHMNHQQPQQQLFQQTLSTHNHLHTAQGCQLQSINASLINAITAAVVNNCKHDRKLIEQPTRNKLRTNAPHMKPLPATRVVTEVKHAVQAQLLLKRPREEAAGAGGKSTTTSGTSKRQPRSHAQSPTQSQAQTQALSQSVTSPQSQSQSPPLSATLPQESVNAKSHLHSYSTSIVAPPPLLCRPIIAVKSHNFLMPMSLPSPLPSPSLSPSPIPTPSNSNNHHSYNSTKSAKVIVNQFHASSLLNAHHHEEKTKILLQNGLTKSAATAYETSLYATNYLGPDNHLGAAPFKIARPLHGEYFNSVGVSLAKPTDHIERSKGGRSNPGDDPCAAIDDVNDYTDSDSEDEYTGYPFYLREDGEETHQSRCIRYDTDKSSLSGSEEETEPKGYYTPKSILSKSLFPKVPPYLNFSSHAQKGPTMPQALHKVLKWKLSPVMPKIVKRVVLNSGFRIIKNTTDWMAIWEKHMKSPGFRTIRSHQKYNHMPGSFRIGRKDSMWRSIYGNMKKYGCKEFGFMQKSYIMPDDLESLRQAWPKNASRMTKWIVKPPASARGTGIRIVNKWSQFPKDRPLVVQKYIERPLLINDNKFDLRIYVVVTSINPLRIYIHKDGLARFASVKYSSELNSLDDRCMHLTNYSINKYSENYSKNEDFRACQGHKWTLQSLWSCLEARGVNTKRLWATLRNLVIKAIISGESGLNRMYRQNVNFRYNCFELFGFDVLLDEHLVPWLLEINISPSLHSELPLDLHVKGPLIQAVLNTALYQVPPKLSERQQNEILAELQFDGPLCHDRRIFTTCLTTEEVRKHNQFTNRYIEFREEYLESILEKLLPDDVRCLIIAEDELARSKPLERIFPTDETNIYLRFIDNPRYYNRLLDAWEYRYGNCREEGIALLRRLCEDGYHLEVSEAILEKEPNVTLTEIDLMHAKRNDDPLTGIMSSTAGDSSQASKAGSPESNADGVNTGVLLAVPCSQDTMIKSSKSTKDTVTTNAKSNVIKVN